VILESATSPPKVYGAAIHKLVLEDFQGLVRETHKAFFLEARRQLFNAAIFVKFGCDSSVLGEHAGPEMQATENVEEFFERSFANVDVVDFTLTSTFFLFLDADAWRYNPAVQDNSPSGRPAGRLVFPSRLF
jgi:hypothetical protein